MKYLMAAFTSIFLLNTTSWANPLTGRRIDDSFITEYFNREYTFRFAGPNLVVTKKAMAKDPETITTYRMKGLRRQFSKLVGSTQKVDRIFGKRVFSRFTGSKSYALKGKDLAKAPECISVAFPAYYSGLSKGAFKLTSYSRPRFLFCASGVFVESMPLSGPAKRFVGHVKVEHQIIQIRSSSVRYNSIRRGDTASIARRKVNQVVSPEKAKYYKELSSYLNGGSDSKTASKQRKTVILFDSRIYPTDIVDSGFVLEQAFSLTPESIHKIIIAPFYEMISEVQAGNSIKKSGSSVRKNAVR